MSVTIYFIFTEEKMMNWYQSKRVIAKRSSLHRSKVEKVEGSTSKDPRYQQFYGNRTVGAVENVNLQPGYPGLYLADSYHLANTIEVPYVYVINVISQSVSEILTQVQQMKQQTTQPIYVEMGNELYSILFDASFPSVSEYIAKCKLIYQGIKGIDPTIRIGIVAVAKDLEDRIAADPKYRTRVRL